MAEEKKNEMAQDNKRDGLPPRPIHDLELRKITEEEETEAASASHKASKNNTSHSSGSRGTAATSFSGSAAGSDNDNRSRCSRETRLSVGNASVAVTLDPSIIQLVSEVQQYGEEPSVVGERPRRKADLYCGSCCDLVRACVICDIIYIFKQILLIVISVFDTQVFIKLDLDQSIEREDFDSYPFEIDRWGFVLLAISAITIAFAGLGIYGVTRFRASLVLSTGIWFLINALLSIYDRRPVGFVFAVLYAYPHIHLFLQMRNGNITPKNYQYERHCCCGFCLRDIEEDDDY